MARFAPALFLCALACATASDVAELTNDNFSSFINGNANVLVDFYAPWCGHCKKLEPEFTKAASALKDKSVRLAKVDATVEKDLAQKYDVKGFPSLIWYTNGKENAFDGDRSSEAIVEWVVSMINAPVTETANPPEPVAPKPNVVLYAEAVLPSFEEAAKAKRRRAAWFFVKSSGPQKVVVQHQGEEDVEMLDGCGDKDTMESFVTQNILPLFGRLDADTFEQYTEAGKGLVWTLHNVDADGSFDALQEKLRPTMAEVAKKFKGRYSVTITEVERFKEAVENMLSVTAFPAIAVQRKAGDRKKYIYEGPTAAGDIIKFIQDVEAGVIAPKRKSEPEPTSNDEPVRAVVGTTLEAEMFSQEKDVLLEVYAPWCGHCKKLEPEYEKLAKKIKREELTDLLSIAKIDGTANDSPIENVDWSGFPTIFFVKAGTREATVYDGERTAKGLWKYIRKHATKAQEIKDRLEKRKSAEKKAEEL